MKEQGSAALRIVAFAVALAFVLGLASVMFQVTASAEAADESTSVDDTISYLGTIGNYQCIKFRYTDGVSVREVLSRFDSYADGSFVQGCVFGYMDGKFYTYTNNNISYQVGKENIVFNNALFYRSWVVNDKFKNPEYCIIESQGSVCSTYRYNNGTDYTYGNLSLIASNCTMADFPSRYGTDFYAIFTSSASSWTKSEYDRFKNDVINNLHDSDYSSPEDSTLLSAKFITCASFTNSDGSFPLWVKDFIAEGHQYPMFTFAISDNGNNHKYSLVLSYNDNDLIAPFIVGMYDELSDSDKRTGFKLTTAISKKFHVSGFVGITNMSDVLKKGCINIFEKNWVNLNYNRAFNLNSSDMDFTDTTGNKVYTITLSDYSAIKANTFYKAELIDLTTSEVLDVTYFTSAQSFNKSDSGNGTKIYDYGDNYDQMWDDLKNNTPSVDPSKGDNFNVGGDVDTNFDNLSNLNINDIISGLRTSISSVSVFFQACWSLFPAAFWSIILLGVSLIIILRILGR